MPQARVIITVTEMDPVTTIKPAGKTMYYNHEGNVYVMTGQSEYTVDVPDAPEGHELTGRLVATGTDDARSAILGFRKPPTEGNYVEARFSRVVHGLDLRWQLRKLPPPPPNAPKREDVLWIRSDVMSGVAMNAALTCGYPYFTFGDGIYRSSSAAGTGFHFNHNGDIVTDSGEIVEAGK